MQYYSWIFGSTIVYSNWWCTVWNCRKMMAVFHFLVLSIQIVFWSTLIVAAQLRKWFIGFWLSTSKSLPAGFSNHTMFIYWQEHYNICSRFTVKSSACIEARYSFNLQFLPRASHIQLTVLTWCLIVTPFTISSVKLCLTERSHD